MLPMIVAPAITVTSEIGTSNRDEPFETVRIAEPAAKSSIKSALAQVRPCETDNGPFTSCKDNLWLLALKFLVLGPVQYLRADLGSRAASRESGAQFACSEKVNYSWRCDERFWGVSIVRHGHNPNP